MVLLQNKLTLYNIGEGIFETKTDMLNPKNTIDCMQINISSHTFKLCKNIFIMII